MADKKKKKSVKKPIEVKKYNSVCYMLPDVINAGQLAEALVFLDKNTVEIWPEVNILEITLTNGTLTFEDMMPELDNEDDKALLTELNVKQVYACDYEVSDSVEVQKIMKSLMEQFGGFLASCTENFQPFLQVEELE